MPRLIGLTCNIMNAAFIVNSKSVRARKLLPVLKDTMGNEHAFLITSHQGAARKLAIDCCNGTFTHVIVLGGDGTLNEVVDGMMSLGRAAEQLPILSVLPCGTGNDFARNFGLTSSISDFSKRLYSGTIMSSDVGIVEISGHNGIKIKRHFINVMDIGLGGEIAQKVNNYRRSAWSFFANQRGILSTLPFYKKSMITCKSKDLNHSGRVLSVVVANGKWFGNGLGIAAEAAINSGSLSIVVLGQLGIFDYLRHLPQIMRCKKIHHSEVFYRESKEIILEGESTAIEVDGEYIGLSPCRIGLCPSAIRLLI